ncbi:TPA: HAMP domain-containing histidine kinase, partial [Serratia marcescens]|nr:HAMP domain-containing histidine kinase [Serratia marcescens]
VVAEEHCENISYIYEGVQPCIIKSDPRILCLALSNGIRNALESINSYDLSDRDLTICWGATNVDNWVSIIDTGTGLLGSPEAAFKIGNTNKPNHTGFGMAIIQQAVENLGGDVTLSNIASGGAKLDLRWGNF